jgi:hypothetical protein
MLEAIRRKKQRMQAERDALMRQYHQIKSYLTRIQCPEKVSA